MSVRFVSCLVVVVAVGALACDDKKATPTAASASAAASTPPPGAASAAPPAETASAAASASASPFAAATGSLVSGDAKDVILTMKDPTKEPEKTIKVQAGGSLTLFLPDYPGTVWGAEGVDKLLGKAKEEVIPGFAPKTNGHQFKWDALKGGLKQKLQFSNRKAGDKTAKPTSTFTLTVETA